MQLKDIPESVILDAVRAFKAGLASTPDIALADRWPPKLILAKMEKMIDKGVLECGVSVRTAWIDEERQIDGPDATRNHL